MLPKITCIILAGGKGSRLFPLTESRAKPAVRFGGNYRLIDIPISNSLNCGLKDIWVYTQYCPEELQNHIQESFPKERIDPAKILIIHPKKNLNGQVEEFNGTADAVRKSLPELQQTDSEYFLILSGDQLYTMDLLQMVILAEKRRADLVIATLPVKKQDASRFGLMKIGSDASILDFYEKPTDSHLLEAFSCPQDKERCLASMGIYLFRRESLFALLQERGDDFGKDLIPKQLHKKAPLAFVYDGYWEDIGTIPSFYQANMALLQQRNCLDTTDERFPIFTTPHSLPVPIIRNSLVSNSLLSPGVVLETMAVFDSIIGLNTYVGKGSIIEKSIILGGTSYSSNTSSIIGENCHIKGAILDERCRLGKGVKLLNPKKLDHFDGSGIYIRHGIMIVGAGVTIPDHFVL